jgi:hypothetical protein
MAGLAMYLSRNHSAIWNSASNMKHNGLLRRVLSNEEHKGPQKVTVPIRTNMILANFGINWLSYHQSPGTRAQFPIEV